MLLRDVLLLYDYAFWARDRLLTTAGALTHAQLTVTVLPGLPTIHATLVHSLSAEEIWLRRWQGQSPTAMLSADELPTLEAIGRRWQDTEQELRSWLATLHDADLLQVCAYRTLAGQPDSQPLEMLLLHVLNHGTQHRSEVALLLTELGCSPGDLDFIRYIRKQAL